MANPRHIRAIRFKLNNGICAIVHAKGSDKREISSCFQLIENEEPPLVRPVTCEAEITMMSPKKRIPSDTVKKVIKVFLGFLNIKQISLLLLQIDYHDLHNF